MQVAQTSVMAERQQNRKALLQHHSADQTPLSADETAKLIEELENQRIELQRQNEELQKARDEAEAARARYADFYDFAPVGYFTLSPHGLITQSNPAAARMVGLAPAELQGRAFGTLVAVVDREIFSNFLQHVFAAGTAQSCEVQLATRHPFALTIHLEANLSRDGRECRATAIDITEHKIDEAALIEHAETYNTLLATTPDGVFVTDERAQFLQANQVYCDLLGYTQDELVGMSIREIEGIETAAEIQQRTQQMISEGKARFESRHRAKDGQLIDLEISITHIPRQRRFVSFARNITARKRAEAALRESQGRWQFALEGAGDGVWDWDVATNTVFFSRRWKEIIGYTETEIGAGLEEWSSRVHPDDLPSVMADLQTHLDGRTAAYANEHRMRCKDGSYKWILDRGLVIARDATGKPLRVVGTHGDITTRKQNESKLQKREAELAWAMDLANLAYWELDLTTNTFVFNDRFYALFATTSAREGGNRMAPATYAREFILPEEAHVVADEIDRIKSMTEPYVERTIEHRIRRRDGAIRHLAVRIVATRDAAGQLLSYRGANQDITELRQAEAERSAHEARLHQAQNLAKIGIWEWDVTTDLTVWSDEMLEIYGLTREEFTGRGQDYLAFTHPEDRTTQTQNIHRDFADATRKAQQTGVQCDATVAPKEFRIVRRDGTVRWVTGDAVEYVDARGQPLRMHGVLQDITARKLAEIALAENRALLIKLTEQVPGVVYQYRLHPDGHSYFPYASPGIKEIYGVTPEAVREDATPVFGRLHPGDYDMIVATIQESARTLQIYHSEFRVILPGQGVRWRLCDAKPERLPDGSTLWHGIISDITDRKLTELELHKLARAVEQSPVVVVVTCSQGAINYVNPQFTKVTGYTLDEVKGKKPSFLKSGLHSPELYRDLWATISSGREWRGELCNKRKDGSLYWEDASISPVVDETGNITHYLAVKEDITARRATEAKLREQAALLDVAQDAIMVLNLDRTVTYWNRAAEKIYGYTAAEALGHKYEELLYTEVPADFSTLWTEHLKQGTFAGDRHHHTRAGKKIAARVRSTVVRDARDTVKSILVVVTDVTESKQLEAQFLRAQRMESLGALASGVAHDLNNVLTPILISVELLRPLAKAKHDHEMLQLLSDSARRGADIVQQLLLFGRGSDTPRSAMNASGVVKDVGRMMRETFPKNLVLSIQAPADLRLVEADKTQIHQVLLNLCVNARDAMPQGGRLTVTAENTQVDESFARRHGASLAGPYVLLRVADTGIGIPAAHLEKIFDPFFTTKPIGEGTGLGLATVLGIVRGHGGFLVVNSTEGTGTTFEIYLPATQSAVEAVASNSNPLALLGRGEWILIVDDEESIRSVLQQTLAGNNYHVLVASDGAEALGVFAQNAAKIKLVITDAMMPVMDGAQTLRALRRLNPHLPVVAISGLSAHRAEFEKNFGPRLRFLPKPFSSELALQLVRGALDEAYPIPPSGRFPAP